MTRTGQARGAESGVLVRGWEGRIWDEVETANHEEFLWGEGGTEMFSN